MQFRVNAMIGISSGSRLPTLNAHTAKASSGMYFSVAGMPVGTVARYAASRPP